MSGRSRLVRRSWPVGPIDLLLQTGLAPEERARQAWAVWASTRDFERISGAERRLVAAFSERIGTLDPLSPLRPRIDGLTKLLWTRAQLTLGQTANAFDRLAAAGIPFLVFKGGALLAEGFATSRRRIIGDVDILVRRDSAEAAIDALTGAGWCSVNGESPAYLRRLAQVRISGNYRRGEHGEIDLHISPFHFGKSEETLDEALWRDARPAVLAARKILIPDPTDAIVISLAHAPMSNSVEWALDVVTRIAQQPVDWNKLVDVANRRGLVPACLAGLRYLHEVLEAPVPQSALSALTNAPVTFGARLKYWSNVSDRQDRGLVEKAANRWADRMLRKQGYSHFVKDRVAITVTRPTMRPDWLRLPAQELPVPASAWGIEHELFLGREIPGRRLAVKLAILRPPVSRRIFFDVTADGIALARLRSRSGPPAQGEETLTFLLPIARSRDSDMRISIESRPVGFLPPNARKSSHAELGPIEFRLLRAILV